MLKIRDSDDHYALASSRAPEPKHRRHSNFMRAKPGERHGMSRKEQGYDRLNFRARVFAVGKANKVKAARKCYEASWEAEVKRQRKAKLEHSARMKELLWYIREVCPIVGPVNPLP